MYLILKFGCNPIFIDYYSISLFNYIIKMFLYFILKMTLFSILKEFND